MTRQRNGFIGTVALLLLSSGVASAEDSFALNRPSYPPSSAENRIIKWCAESGHVRYASANIQLQGYVPCGEVKTAITCDAVGNRRISSDGNVPYDHRDCSQGKRLVVIRHDIAEPTPDGRGFSSSEQLAMNREFKEIQRDQEKQEAKNIEAAMRGFAGMFFGGPELKKLQRTAQSRSSQKKNQGQQIDLTQLMRALNAP